MAHGCLQDLRRQADGIAYLPELIRRDVQGRALRPEQIGKRQRQVGIGVNFLGNVSDAHVRRPRDLTLMRQQIQESFQQDGLAGAIWAKDAQTFARRQIETEILDHRSIFQLH